jgi:hypothetical protein
MKFTAFIISHVIGLSLFAQTLTLVDTFSSTRPIDTWTMDKQQNLFTLSQNNIQKKAIFGNLTFNQSFKSLGDIHSIIPVNTFKILLFSDQQQSLTIVDNTLTEQGNAIDFAELNFSNVALVCASNRPNLIWVYDQFRSSLNLVDFQQSEILQSIQNVETKGNSILDMKEYQDHLYVLFSDGMMNRYDFLLNFSGSYALETCQQFGFWNQQIVCLDANATSLRFVPVNMRASQRIPDWQVEGPITSFILQGELLGIQNGSIISLFTIK